MSNDTTTAIVVAVCDAYVTNALRKAGKFVLKKRRGRFNEFRNALVRRSLHEAHVMWPLDVFDAGKAVNGEWETLATVLPRHSPNSDPAALARMLDSYTLDLLVTGRPHTAEALRSALGA